MALNYIPSGWLGGSLPGVKAGASLSLSASFQSQIFYCNSARVNVKSQPRLVVAQRTEVKRLNFIAAVNGMKVHGIFR